MQNSSFIFDSFDIDLPNKRLTFNYGIKQGEETISLSEQFILPKNVERTIPKNLLDSIGAQLHLIVGISYWKLFCSKEIIVKSTTLSKEQAEFWNTVYTYGLGEFFYRNKIDYRNLVQFPVHSASPQPIALPNTNRSLVGVGGGKDSIVSLELLKKAHKNITGYSVTKEHFSVIQDTINHASIDALAVRRFMDPSIAKLNQRDDTYNGHVPVSAIYAFVGVLIAILYDYRYIIASNEQSANYGNVEYFGKMINHQWSKSLEFENLFRDYIHQVVTPDVTYFSLLRPWQEIKIAEVFSRYPAYFDSFSSCNRNFSSTRANPSDRLWCGECPKCAFVFILLSAFIKKDQLIHIFGENLFKKEHLIPVFKELLALEGIKPFECVGTPEETAVAFYMAHEAGEYEDDIAMKMFVRECLPTINDIEQLRKVVFLSADISSVPEEFREVIKNSN